MYKYKEEEGDLFIYDSPRAIFYIAFTIINIIAVTFWILGYFEWWGVLISNIIHFTFSLFFKRITTNLDMLSNTITIKTGNMFFADEENIRVRDVEKFYIVNGEGMFTGELGALAVRANQKDYIIVEADLALGHFNKLRNLQSKLIKHVEHLNRFEKR